MKDPMRFIERFSYKHPHFGIRNLMKYISIGSGLFWLLGMVNPVLMSYLSFDAQAILHGQVWRLVSFLFYPPDSGFLALVAIYFYYWIGSTLEQYWGTPQFNIYMLIGYVLTVLYGFLCTLVFHVNIAITCTYLYLSMFFSFAVLFPEMQVLLFFIIPVKMKVLAIVDAVFFIYGVIVSPFPVNLLPIVAVLNFAVFFGGELLHRLPRRASRNTINFRREAGRVRREQRQQLYTHKCAVCGRTDASNPELEFRYCSRCAGYHCFCQEHINNHIHFTE